MWASGSGYTATVQALIRAGADLNLQNQVGDTALIWASEQGHTATAQALTGAGADINLGDNVSRGQSRHTMYSATCTSL
jgi:ankyrin repeat protein